MLKNTTISLEPTSPERIDAINTIKYTFLLNYDAPKIGDNTNNLISQVMENCQKCCSSLFSSTDYHIAYDFFGDLCDYTSSSLSYLNSYPSVSNINGIPSNISIHSMILQNCIMSSYHAILTALLSGKALPIYTFHSIIENKGIHCLYKKHALNFTDSGPQIDKTKLQSTLDSKQKSSLASAFRQKIDARNFSNESLMNFVIDKKEPISQRNCNPQLQYSTLCNAMCKIPSHSLKKLYSTKSCNLSTEAFVKILENNINELTPSIEKLDPISPDSYKEYGGSIVDLVYHYYLAERSCNINLLYSLLKNIERTKHNFHYSFSDKEILKILSKCRTLQNPFSRTYFLHFAFDHIDLKNNSYLDFWHTHNYEHRSAIVTDARYIYKGFEFSKWLRQYDQFIDYMSQYVIPIYDWCFLNMLLESIEHHYPNKSHTFHLETIMTLLANYITEEYHSILQPITFVANTNMSEVDMITPKNFFPLLNNFSEQQLNILREYMLCENIDTELNLQPLNPTRFRGQNGENLSDIQNLYLDLLIYPHR